MGAPVQMLLYEASNTQLNAQWLHACAASHSTIPVCDPPPSRQQPKRRSHQPISVGLCGTLIFDRPLSRFYPLPFSWSEGSEMFDWVRNMGARHNVRSQRLPITITSDIVGCPSSTVCFSQASSLPRSDLSHFWWVLCVSYGTGASPTVVRTGKQGRSNSFSGRGAGSRITQRGVLAL